MRYLGLFLIVAGEAILLVAIAAYHRLLYRYRQFAYRAQWAGTLAQRGALAFLYALALAVVFGWLDVLRRDTEPASVLPAAMFCFGALVILVAVYAQQRVSNALHQKNAETMRVCINAVELKDPYTKEHCMHVYKIVDLFYETLPMEHQQAVSKPKLLDAALLHDVGKLGIDDEILNKKGALTEGEWDLIRQHPRNGKAALSGTCYDDVADWICYHHERVDGRGYYGLSKDEIPLASKIIAIADVYSALRADRVYRPKFTHEESCQIMRNASGTQFDQTLLRCFLKIDRQALDEITMKTYSRRETAGALIASSEG